MAFKDAILMEFDHETASTRRLLERVPDASLGWKPHARSMSLAGLATHISNLPSWTSIILDRPSFDLAEAPPNLEPKPSRAAVLQWFEETTRAARSSMDKSDGEWAAMWSLRRGGHEMFSLPRASAFRTFVMSHLIHHRGQLPVYLRLLDVPLPSIYGPTADEAAG